MSELDILGMIPKYLPDKLKTLVGAAVDIIQSDKHHAKKALLLAALFYVAYTFDVCPDWIPYIGYLDDISILAAILDNWK